jgi:hypothetical protein
MVADLERFCVVLAPATTGQGPKWRVVLLSSCCPGANDVHQMVHCCVTDTSLVFMCIKIQVCNNLQSVFLENFVFDSQYVFFNNGELLAEH